MGWSRGLTHHPLPFRRIPKSLCFHAENVLQTRCNPDGFNKIASRKHGAIQMPSPCNHEMTVCKPVDYIGASCNLHASSKFTSCLQSASAATDPGHVSSDPVCPAMRCSDNGTYRVSLTTAHHGRAHIFPGGDDTVTSIDQPDAIVRVTVRRPAAATRSIVCRPVAILHLRAPPNHLTRLDRCNHAVHGRIAA